MEGHQPGTPLLNDGALQPQGWRFPSTHTITRKPVPKSDPQPSQMRSMMDYEQARTGSVNDTSASKYEPVSASPIRQPHTSLEQYGKLSSAFGRPKKTNGTGTGRLRHIALICLFLVLPLYGVTAALLIVIYKNRLADPQPDSGSDQCSGIVVDYGASQLTSLSTWISTVATLLAPAFMSLISYPIAKSMTRRSETDRRLPSPYQTGLLIELLGGSLIGLWNSLSYSFSRRRAHISPLLYISYAGLLCGVLFGVLTQLADFWLHRATYSMLYTVSQPVNAAQYGRQLSSYCKNYYQNNLALNDTCTGVRLNMTEENPPCSVACGEYDFYPVGYEQSFLLVNSLPAANTLAVTSLSRGDDSRSGSLVVLLPADVDSNITWSASTVGVSTQCEYLFDKCHTEVYAEGARFDCGSAVPPTGYDADGQPISFNGTGFFGTIPQTLLANPSDQASVESFTLPNPWTVGFAMRVSAVVPEKNLPDNLLTGTNTIFTILSCSTTTYDIEYSIGHQAQNGTSSVSTSATPPITVNKLELSNSNVHNTLQRSILISDTVKGYVERAMLAAIFSATKDGEVLPRFEQEFSKVGLSFGAPSFENIPSTQRNAVQQRVVSCVELAPLWSLVGLVGVYITAAIILATVAIMSSSGNNVRGAQLQLSVTGLAAKAFDGRGGGRQHRSVGSTEDLFDEGMLKREALDREGQDWGRVSADRIGFRVNDVGNWVYDKHSRGVEQVAANNRF